MLGLSDVTQTSIVQSLTARELPLAVEGYMVYCRTVNGATRLAGQPGQVLVPTVSRADVSAHGFWTRWTTAIFDSRIVNLDAGSYLRMTPEKALAKAEKEKKDLYLQACL